MRKFEGAEGYETLTFNRDTVEGLRGSLLGMRMVAGATDQAEVEYSLSGKVRGLDVELQCTDTITLHLVTGRVERHVSKWTASGAGAGAYRALRTAWAGQMAARDLLKGADKMLASVDEESDAPGVTAGGAADPTKFFQGGGQDQQNLDDAITYAMVLAVVWALFKAYQTIFSV